jgi:uncharacterized membrane protein YeaQ/YmgE (transglycosylase-associated protein family)
MGIIGWVIFGLIAGSISNLIDPRPSVGGSLGSIILGIAGAVIGGFLSSLLFGIRITGFNFTSFAIAVLGSLLVLFLSRAFSEEGV